MLASQQGLANMGETSRDATVTDWWNQSYDSLMDLSHASSPYAGQSTVPLSSALRSLIRSGNPVLVVHAQPVR